MGRKPYSKPLLIKQQSLAIVTASSSSGKTPV